MHFSVAFGFLTWSLKMLVLFFENPSQKPCNLLYRNANLEWRLLTSVRKEIHSLESKSFWLCPESVLCLHSLIIREFGTSVPNLFDVKMNYACLSSWFNFVLHLENRENKDLVSFEFLYGKGSIFVNHHAMLWYALLAYGWKLKLLNE